ncbi:UNVERIFIED_CONTAM: hypothetical protein Sradi_1087300 [Sesamum radiatum]|uniref:Neprosin PEP catalytic domain-containing protein n=1 Tax=Sesamum radiatum TaxID=300843 RepID=A0AAW2V9G5_SESRA
MDMKVRVGFWLVFLFMAPVFGAAARSGVARRNLEVRRHLSRVNKPSVKSIKLSSRRAVQPEQESGQERDRAKANNSAVAYEWEMPRGNIPIRRTREEDMLRASSIKAYGKKIHKSIPRPTSVAPEPDLITQNGHQHAIAYVEGDQYYGAKATINVWDPKIQQSNEFSLSQLWILGGSFASDLNSIEAGWQVSPDLYGDNNTRLFTYWTSDAYQATGCYNLLCSGFIQINNEIAMGASIYPLSSYRSSQYDISILVWKDPKEGNWWMQFGNDYVLGYWPAFLFSYLSDSASMIEWGGEVVNSESDGSTPLHKWAVAISLRRDSVSPVTSGTFRLWMNQTT